MSPKGAITGDVTATPSSVPSPKAGVGGSGTWTAGTVTYKSYAKLKAPGEVIWKAECTFTFSGANSAGSAVTDSERVTLTATATVLQHGSNGVLLDAEQEQGPLGNRLTVTASGHVAT